MELDGKIFPRSCSYLRSLPAKLGSFPDCTNKAETFADVADSFPELLQHEPLPPAIRQFLRKECATDRVREVFGNLLLLMVRDTAFDSDQAFFEYYRSAMRKLFQRPLNRALMAVFSPTLVVMGAAKRWDNFHTGTQLQAQTVEQSGSRLRTALTLTFPPGLYEQLMLETLAYLFLAVLDMTKAVDPQSRLEAQAAGSATYLVSWEK